MPGARALKVRACRAAETSAHQRLRPLAAALEVGVGALGLLGAGVPWPRELSQKPGQVSGFEAGEAVQELLLRDDLLSGRLVEQHP